MKFTVSTIIKAGAKEIYTAWLDSKGHAEMTGGEAECSDQVGGKFTAWDGYIWGENLELEPFSRIKQAWRTSQFEESDKDSIVEVTFAETEVGTQITIEHSELAEDGGHYLKGWENHYFTPMKEHFEG